tara:strand:+ start:339 stop:626 length:288 start_codon:yes stop_codon:yes gene_type:complete
MENQKKKKLDVVSNIWKNWCSLEADQRTEVANKLGPLGHMLSIAANVHQLAVNPTSFQGNTNSNTQANDPNVNSSSQSNNGTEEEIIDVEYEEVP